MSKKYILVKKQKNSIKQTNNYEKLNKKQEYSGKIFKYDREMYDKYPIF